MVGTVYENKGRSMRHTAVMAENRTESSEGNYTSSDKTVMSLMQNSNYLALKLAEAFKFLLIQRYYYNNGNCSIKEK